MEKKGTNSIFPHKSGILMQNFIIIYGANRFLHWFITGISVPILTLLILKRGYNLAESGILISIYSAFVFFLELPTGGLADTVGRKKIYLISLWFYFCSVLLILFSTNFISMIAGFSFLGISRALFSGSLDAWFIDTFNQLRPKGNLQASLANIGTAENIGLGTGTILGGLLPMWIGPYVENYHTFDRYSGNLLVMIFAISLQVLFTYIFIKENFNKSNKFNLKNNIEAVRKTIVDSFKYGLKNEVIFKLLLISGFWGLVISSVELLWQPGLKGILETDENTFIFGVVSAGYFFSCAFGNIIVTRICKLFNNNYLLIAFMARLLMGVVLLTLSFQYSLIGFISLYWILFTCNGLEGSPKNTVFNQFVPTDMRSTILSLDSFTMQIGGFLGALSFGQIANTYSIKIAWIIGSILLILSSLIYFSLLSSKKYKNHLQNNSN